MVLHKKLQLICSNEADLYHFAYELRIYDQNDMYTFDLLKDHVDQLTMQIILSNKW